MNGLPYYKAYPRDFVDGTAGWTLELKGAYRVVLDLIYLQGGRLPDDPRYISGHLGCSVKKWNSLRAELISRGKLHEREGALSNDRADKELETLGKYQDKQRENASGPRKNKGLEKPRPSHTDTDTDITQAKACDGQAVDGPFGVEDFASELWTRGVVFLVRKGVAEKNARSFIGGLRSKHADKDIFEAFQDCSKAGVVDPIPWLVAALASRGPNVRPITRIDMEKFNQKFNEDGSYKQGYSA